MSQEKKTHYDHTFIKQELYGKWEGVKAQIDEERKEIQRIRDQKATGEATFASVAEVRKDIERAEKRIESLVTEYNDWSANRVSVYVKSMFDDSSTREAAIRNLDNELEVLYGMGVPRIQYSVGEERINETQADSQQEAAVVQRSAVAPFAPPVAVAQGAKEDFFAIFQRMKNDDFKHLIDNIDTNSGIVLLSNKEKIRFEGNNLTVYGTSSETCQVAVEAVKRSGASLDLSQLDVNKDKDQIERYVAAARAAKVDVIPKEYAQDFSAQAQQQLNPQPHK